MLDFLTLFKKVRSLVEWKKVAQDALRKKQFLIEEAINALHLAEAEQDEMGMDRERSMPTMGGGYSVQNRGFMPPPSASSFQPVRTGNPFDQGFFGQGSFDHDSFGQDSRAKKPTLSELFRRMQQQ